MTFALIDLIIVVAYLLATVFVGLIMKKRALKGLDAYYLAERDVPWWMLGLAGCSSYVDIGGTMIIIGLMFYLGIKSMWILHFVWGFFTMAFFMGYQAKYVRRSGVMTLVEWNTFRFGSGRDTVILRYAVASFLLVVLTATLVYVAVGTGKFAEELLPLSRWQSTFIIFVVVGAYVTFGGFFGVILTDVFQTILIFIGTAVLAGMAFWYVGGLPAAVIRDPGWASLIPSWSLWDTYLTTSPSSYHQFYPFGPLLLGGSTWMVLRAVGGPYTWDFTFFLSTRSVRQASLAAGMWTVAHTVRWFIALSFISLGVYYLGTNAGADAERLLPQVVRHLPMGLSGIFLAVLLAALMSTISAMITLTSSVTLNDFIKPYARGRLSERTLVRLGMLASVATLTLSFGLSFLYEFIMDAWEFLMYALNTVVMVPMVLRWHWWRFSARAFVWSMVLSTLVVVVQRVFLTDIPLFASIVFLNGLSFLVTVAVTFVTRPTTLDVLVPFYVKTRPFGFWKPVREEAIRQGLVPAQDPEPRRDLGNAIIASVLQFSLGVSVFYLFLREWSASLGWVAVGAGALLILYFTWYRTLPAEG